MLGGGSYYLIEEWRQLSYYRRGILVGRNPHDQNRPIKLEVSLQSLSQPPGRVVIMGAVGDQERFFCENFDSPRPVNVGQPGDNVVFPDIKSFQCSHRCGRILDLVLAKQWDGKVVLAFSPPHFQ